MPALFIVLGIAVLTLLALLLWFVPHLLQQQAQRSAGESAQLREMLLDMLNEQEAVTLRQAQLGTSLGYLQDQLEQLIQRPVLAGPQLPLLSDEGLSAIENRLAELQQQIAAWGQQTAGTARPQPSVDEESWSNLMRLLLAIQSRLGELSVEHDRRSAQVQTGAQARQLLEELEQELDHLHSIADDITRLQLRLRHSLNARDLGVPVMRSTGRGLQVSS